MARDERREPHWARAGEMPDRAEEGGEGEKAASAPSLSPAAPRRKPGEHPVS